MTQPRRILFLQGPLSPLYSKLGEKLRREGPTVHRINLCLGDHWHWRAGEADHFRGKPDDWARYIASYLDKHGITDLVCHGDRRFYHKLAIKEARARGIYVAVTELGLIRPDWMTLERNSLSVRSHFPSDPAAVRAISEAAGDIDFTPRFKTSFFKVAAPDIAYNLLNTFVPFFYPHYQRHTLPYPPLEYLAQGFRMMTEGRRNREASRVLERLKGEARPYFLVPLQLNGDFQVRENSSFGSMVAGLRSICQSFAAHASDQTVLLMKSHPLDDGLIKWPAEIRKLESEFGLKGRLFFADGGDLFAMAEGAVGAVSVNSTAALDVLRRGLPTKTLAPTLFDMEGLTDQAPLADFWSNPKKPDPDMVAHFVRAIAATVQVRGTIYDDAGLLCVVDKMAERLLDRSVNEPGGFVDPPPRLHPDLGIPD